MKTRRKKKETKKRIVFGLFIIMILGIASFLLLQKSNMDFNINPFETEITPEPVEEEKLEIIDPDSNSRNIAVMINNIKSVWGYQSGIQDAYIVYEILAEGGITRLMAIYKDQDTSRIGSVRSARIYYLDYALENDAIYVHVGGSKEALSDIRTLKIPSLNGTTIYRDKSLGLSTEHTAFTSIDCINEEVESRNIRNTTTMDPLFNYSIDEIDLSEREDAILANDVYISFSGSKSTSFKYDPEKKVYLRYQNDTSHIDHETKEQYSVKNIITYQVRNHSYDSYGRQELDNIGSGEGYFITDGYAVPITWEKTSRESQTVYRYLDGEEIILNDGNTHIEIQPINRKLTLN